MSATIGRRALLAGLAGTAATLPFRASAQETKNRIAVVRHYSAPPPSSVDPSVEALRRGLTDLGYVEGENIVIDYRWTDGRPENLQAIATELAERSPSLVVTHGEAATHALSQASSRLSIVVAIVGDLVENGYAASLARPGGNVTGLIDASPDLSAKRLQIAADLVPGAPLIAVLWNAANRVKALDLQQTVDAARRLRLRVQSFPVNAPRDFAPAFASLQKSNAGAVLVLVDALTIRNTGVVMGLADQAGLPVISAIREFALSGALATYGPNVVDSWRRAAGYVDRVLKGARPSDLPIEQPTKFELVVNLKKARALGINIPSSILVLADEVIE